jgi:hypothetical protein
MNVIPNLFALVSKNAVELALSVAFDQVAQESMQLDAAVVGSREATAPQAAGLHPEVTAIFLHHDISRHLRSSKQAVLALVDRKIFGDAFTVSRILVVPPRLEFFQRDSIGTVTVHFVRAHVHENSLRGVTPRRLKEIQGPKGVDVKVVERSGSGEIMTGLSSGVNNHVWLQRLETRKHLSAMSNVQFVVLKLRVQRLEPPLVPTRVATGPEEIGPHVVVDTMDLPIQPGEIIHDFRPDQSGRTGDQ